MNKKTTVEKKMTTYALCVIDGTMKAIPQHQVPRGIDQANILRPFIDAETPEAAEDKYMVIFCEGNHLNRNDALNSLSAPVKPAYQNPRREPKKEYKTNR